MLLADTHGATWSRTEKTATALRAAGARMLGVRFDSRHSVLLERVLEARCQRLYGPIHRRAAFPREPATPERVWRLAEESKTKRGR